MKSVTMSTVVISLIFLVLFSIDPINGISSNVAGCIKSERQALLRFKQHLTDPSNRLASWIADGDCCSNWAGVICDNFTGHVLELHLRNPHLDILMSILETQDSMISNNQLEAGIEAYFNTSSLGGKINFSLLDLKHLIHLDLSGNYFGGIQIPRFIGSMENLRYLNLSMAGFSGLIPHQLGNLSILQYLDLSDHFSGNLSSENLFWLSSLSLLEQLDLSGVNLAKSSDWLPMINALSSLKVLKLSDCELDHIPPLDFANFSSLATLDLSSNQISNPIPGWIFGLSYLVFLDLKANYFEGPLPNGFQNLSISLKHVDLSINYFNSSIPNWLFRFNHLQHLGLSHNRLQAAIPSALGNLTSLEVLSMSYNDQVEGRISRSFGTLCNLRSIYLSSTKLSQKISEILDIFSGCVSDKLELLSLSNNQIFGGLTDQIGKFKNLHTLYLSKNSISCPIPSSLGQLWSLKFLDISSNKLNGTLCEIHFINLTRLSYFVASNNSLKLKVSPDWIPPFQLNVLRLRSCSLGPRFPSWLFSQKFLFDVDISNSRIFDVIPSESWKYLSQLDSLNLSHNQIHGQIPSIEVFQPYLLDLSSNNLSGPLPLISSKGRTIDLSKNMFSGSISRLLCYRINDSKQAEILNLRGNFLSGQLPDCWKAWRSLLVLDLGDNKFSGNLPTSVGTLSALLSLHLQKNNMSGTLPVSLENCTHLISLDISDNEFVGNVPTWIGERFSSSMLILNFRSNKFHGVLPVELCLLTYLHILDLSNNSLSGNITRCFNNFSAMVSTYQAPTTFPLPSVLFSYNGFVEDASLVMKGKENEYSTILRLVRSMDLSNNCFSGEIPIQVTNLEALQSLNLSHNFFTGRIPDTIGAMRSLECMDFSLNRISGEIPQSISNLTFLSHLNLSNNNLIGMIPSSTQLQSLDESSFAGNELCGSPLKNCTNTVPVPNNGSGEGKNGNDSNEPEVDWFYVSMALGFVVGFWIVIGPLLVNKRWRYAYCHLLDRLWDNFRNFVRKCH